VAEGGRGGAASTVGDCRQVPEPVGPYTGGMTARILKIGPTGTVSTVADGLPSSQSTPGSGSLVTGVADVAFVNGTLYALVAGAGCSHGLPGTFNGVYRIDASGSAELIADLGAYRAATTVANPDLNDDEYDGTWYSMVEVDGALYATEPNHGVVVKVTLDGQISRLVDISASQGHIVPTAIAYWPDLDAFFVGNLGRFPAKPRSSKVLRIGRDGSIAEWATGLMTVVGLAVDPDGVLYVLENTVCDEPCMPKPGAGRIVRLGANGSIEPVASGLMLPTAMTFGPDGALYVSVFGVGPSGKGAILRVDIA
jgi:glucose/arabinose dehydrogenase